MGENELKSKTALKKEGEKDEIQSRTERHGSLWRYRIRDLRSPYTIHGDPNSDRHAPPPAVAWAAAWAAAAGRDARAGLLRLLGRRRLRLPPRPPVQTRATRGLGGGSWSPTAPATTTLPMTAPVSRAALSAASDLTSDPREARITTLRAELRTLKREQQRQQGAPWSERHHNSQIEGTFQSQRLKWAHA